MKEASMGAPDARPPTTKLSALRAAWDSGDRLAALRIAAKFPRLGEHADAIRRGWDAHNRPAFYRQMKRDPDTLVAAALAAVAARYGLTP